MSLYSEYYLAHHGVKGQKWGVRRYQNEDGTLTAAGKKRRYINDDGSFKDLSTKKISTKNAAREMEEVRKEEYERLASRHADRKETTEEMKVLVREHARVVGQKRYRDTDQVDDILEWDDPAHEKRYNDLYKEVTRWARDDVNAGKKASSYILKRYGEQKLSDVNKRKDRIATAKGTALVLVSLPFIPIVATYGLISVGASSKKEKSKTEQTTDK